MARRKSILDYKLRDILPPLGCAVLIFNIIGYFSGFLFVDFDMRYGRIRTSNRLKEDVTSNGRQDSDTASTSSSEILLTKELQTSDVTRILVSESQRAFRRQTPGPNERRRDRTTWLSRSVIQHSEPCVYRVGRAVDDGRWYNFSVPKYTFYAYSALVDDRKSLLSDPVIRIIGLGTKPEDDAEETNLKLFCLLHYQSDQITYVAMNRTAVKIGQGWVLNNEWVREYIFTCPMEQFRVPRALAVVGNHGDMVSSCMPVEVPVKAEKKKDFALCVQVAFDSLDPYRMTEWMELQWLLGVRHVGVYSLLLDKASIDALTHYVKEGFVELRKTDYIEHGPQQYLLQGSPIINDCFYRNIHRFQYIVVIDFDEVIMPKSHQSLRQLVDFLKVNYSTMAFPPVNYIFYNNYFFLELSPDISESPYLTILRYRKKVPVSPFGYSVKSIVYSEACLAMHNHYCWTMTAQYEDRGYPEVVDYSIAVNQHYKNCHLNKTECRELMTNATQDDTILKFRTELKQRVANKILAIRGHNL